MVEQRIEAWVQTASAQQLAAFVNLASARLVTLVPATAVVSDTHAAAGRMLYVADAAQQLGVSCRWIYAHARDLPFVKRFGRSVRIDAPAMESWFEGQNGNGASV